MDKEIKVYRAETKKPRTEFTGIMRMFEPIRNLAITVGSFILISTLVVVVIIIQAQEAARFRLDNWNRSFETWREAWDYVNDNENYEKDDDFIDVYRITNNSNYYNLNSTNHVTYEQAINKLEQRSYDKGEWTYGYSETTLVDGISRVDEEFYSKFNSYKVYDSSSGDIVHTDFDAIESYLTVSGSDFSYRNENNSSLDVVYDDYKLKNTLTFETVTANDFEEYISTDGKYTNIINHLGWKIDSKDFIDDIFQSVYLIEHELKKDLPIGFYTKTIWSDDRFNDNDFLDSFTTWESNNVGSTQTDYLASIQSDLDYSDWKNSIEQINRRAWNCDDHSAVVNIDTCDFTNAEVFEDDLRTYLEDYYATLENIKQQSVIVPALNGVPVVEYLNNLITDESVIERVYLADLLRDQTIWNRSTYAFNETLYPGINQTEGWEGTKLYDDVVEWFNENLNDNGWKYALKTDTLSGNKFNVINGSSTEAYKFDNFNNNGEVIVYDNFESLNLFLSFENITNDTGVSLRETEDRNTFYRLDINHDDEDAFRSLNLIDVINYWKDELNKNRP